MERLLSDNSHDLLDDSISVEIYNKIINWINKDDSRINIAYGILETIYKRCNNSLLKASCKEGMAVYYFVKGDFTKSFEILIDAFSLCPTKESIQKNILTTVWKISENNLLKKMAEELKIHTDLTHGELLVFSMLSVVYQKTNDIPLYHEILGMMEKYNTSFAMFHKGTHVTSSFLTEDDVDRCYKTHVETIRYILDNEDYIKKIRDLLSKCPDVYLEKVGFNTSYMGYNTCYFQKMLSEFYSRLYPFLFYISPHLEKRKELSSSRLKRIGFVSAYLHNHSVGKLFGGVIKHIDRSRFETYVYVTGDEKNFEPYSKKYVHLPNKNTFKETIDTWRDIISMDDLDVLVYPDIGMIPTTYYLSFSRLAHVQAMWWGHTDTASTCIDYFISSRYFEDRENQYAEKLIRHDGLSVIYEKLKDIPDPSITREMLGLPSTGTIYMCVQTIFKWLPHFDNVLCGILDRDPTAIIIGINIFDYQFWKDQVIERIKRRVGHDKASRLVFVTAKNTYQEFLSLCQHATIMLDTFPFGGTTTHLECFGIGKMAITLCGDSLPGSTCTGIYRALDLDKWKPSPISHSVEEYITKALYYAHDHTARNMLEKELIKRMDEFYLSQKEIDGWNSIFEKLTKSDSYIPKNDDS